jgi:hypothetical protein
MPGVFISYRRQDSAGHAGRLFDRLRARLGDDRVFMDVTGIDAGVDFVHTLEQAVGSCEVLLAIIGPGWLASSNGKGRRLDDPEDFVRIEIAAALARNVRVIPVLIAGASLPSAQALPDDLALLGRRQAVELRDARWDSDTEDLVASLERQLGASPGGKRLGPRTLAVAGLIAAVAIAVPAVRYFGNSAAPGPAAPSADAPTDAGLSLRYSITARPNPSQYPDSVPALLGANGSVSAGDLVRFSFESPQGGFLYVVNESPPDADGRTSFNVLFPSPTSNQGSARVPAGGRVVIPESGDGFQVDGEEGAERLWLVSSTNAINELDAVAHWANPRDQGEIKSAEDIELVRGFLVRHASPAPQVQLIEGDAHDRHCRAGRDAAAVDGAPRSIGAPGGTGARAADRSHRTDQCDRAEPGRSFSRLWQQ